MNIASILRGPYWLWFVLLAVFNLPALAAENIDPARVREITAMLAPRAAGAGQPITNRAAWENLLAQRPELKGLIADAAKTAAKSLPAWPDSLYLDFSKNGNRYRWQKAEGARRDRIEQFTLAECLENKGRFLAPLEQAIVSICAEPTWVLSAHDRSLKNYRGETVEVDLGAAGMGAELATAYYVLGEKLSAPTRKLICDNLDRRIFAPYRAAVNGQRPEFWWMQGANNWNAVCADGVTTTALAVLDSPEERAWFIAVAEKNVGHYLAGGFTPDGYCVEGLGYWNYGFGNYALLAENIRQATGGKVDLLTEPRAAQPALFGARSEILNGVYLTIADCHPGQGPSGILMNYLCRRFGLDAARWRNAELAGGLYEKMLFGFLPADLPLLKSANDLAELPWRTWFPDGGVLICRPGADARVPFAVAIKGGNNGVSHGHNDAGSFSVVAGTNMVICDPGGEVYTARTFSARRYDSKVLNSFGHAVPVVAGQLQRTGGEARAVVLDKEFTPAADTLKLDLRSAYPVPDLQKLERTFVFQRGNSPALEVRDEVTFAAPNNFETALVTWGKIRRISETVVEIADGNGAVRVSINTQGQPFRLKQETINEDVSSKTQPVRLGIVLDKKVVSAAVALRITPVTGK